MDSEKLYVAIDLKSFYASVECVERGLNPLTTNLVVADASRTEKTICLAVTPSLKKFGIPGRARLFEVVQKVKEINRERLSRAPGHKFTGSSIDAIELDANPSLKLDFIAAKPQMALYMKYSTSIYNIYLKYIAPEDIHVYSIDEVFMDVTTYLNIYKISAKELCQKMIKDVMHFSGITATGGIGTNLYLCKVAMDIMAKHTEPDENGVRIAHLDEESYRRKLWTHRPLTDFWRIGRGYTKKLEELGLMTMGDVARCSIGSENDFYNEDLLYKKFGINAELLIDHAWGYEPCTIKEIKAFKPENNSISQGQVLHCAYTNEKARLIISEMAELLVLDLVSKKMLTDQIVLTVGYDIENLDTKEKLEKYKGEITYDHYGRLVPKQAHGSINLGSFNASTKIIVEKTKELFDSITDKNLSVRRMYVVANHIKNEAEATGPKEFHQMSLMDLMAPQTDTDVTNANDRHSEENLKKERKIQEAILNLQKRYGKNAVLKGMNLEEGAMTIERNGQIGGHKA